MCAKVAVALAFLSLLPFAVALTQAGPEPAPAWRAFWIGASDESRPNQWICHRKTLELTTLPQKAVASIAVDSKYWLWINGTLVVYEGQLKRGPNPNDTYYDEVDPGNVATYLVEVNNTGLVTTTFDLRTDMIFGEFSSPNVTLDPGENVTVTLSIPANVTASLPMGLKNLGEIFGKQKGGTHQYGRTRLADTMDLGQDAGI